MVMFISKVNCYKFKTNYKLQHNNFIFNIFFTSLKSTIFSRLWKRNSINHTPEALCQVINLLNEYYS